MRHSFHERDLYTDDSDTPTLVQRAARLARRVIAAPFIAVKDFAVGMVSAVFVMAEGPLMLAADISDRFGRAKSAVTEMHDAVIGLAHSRTIAAMGATASGVIAIAGIAMAVSGTLSPKRTFNSAADCPPAQVAAAQATVARCVAPQPSAGPR